MKKSLLELTSVICVGNTVYNDATDDVLIIMTDDKKHGVLFEREAKDSEFPDEPWENWFDIIDGEVVAQFDMIDEEKQYIIDHISKGN